MMTKKMTTEIIGKLLVAGFLLFPASLLAQNPNEEPPADDEPVRDTGRPMQVSFKNRPSLRIGEFANLDLKAKFHLDFRGFDPNSWNPPAVVNALPETPPTFYLTRARVGVKGKFTDRVSYEFERDMRETLGSDHEWHPWKDNYVNINLHRLLQVEVGKFKMPFGMEAN